MPKEKQEKQIFVPEVSNKEYKCPQCGGISILEKSCGRCGWEKKSGEK